MNMKISLSKGGFVLVDDVDYPILNQYKWYLHTSGYARTSLYVEKKHVKLYMHRLIMNTPRHLSTDHINGNRLDNRRSNLRICTESQNRMNTGLRSNNKSGYKGVSWDKEKKKWTVRVRIEGKAKYLGYFTNKIVAAKVYNEWASKLYGEYARINIINE